MASTRASRGVGDDQEFRDVARDSRLYYRRSLAMELAKVMVRAFIHKGMVVDCQAVSDDATTIAQLSMDRLVAIEEREMSMMVRDDDAKH